MYGPDYRWWSAYLPDTPLKSAMKGSKASEIPSDSRTGFRLSQDCSLNLKHIHNKSDGYNDFTVHFRHFLFSTMPPREEDVHFSMTQSCIPECHGAAGELCLEQ